MKERSVGNFTKAAALALGILFLLYCTAGTCGYLTFGTKVLPDIMQSYDASDPIVMVGIIALAVKMITTYPPMLFCGRYVRPQWAGYCISEYNTCTQYLYYI